jgi:glutathione S-transferase
VAPHILLEDTRLDAELFPLVIGEVTDNFTKSVNPKGRVPVLGTDSDIITEIPAIMTAIAQLVPEKNYVGSTPLETVRVYEWIN